ETPKPVLSKDPPGAEIYTEENFTLSCGFGGDPAGWEYLWYKDTQGAALPNTDSSRTDGSSYTISSAALSHSGEYWCRAARGRGPFYSEYSNSVTLDISIYRAVENLVRIFVGVAVLIFLSVILSDAFWRRLRRIRMYCTVTGEASVLVFFGTLRAAQSSSGVLLTADPPWSDMFAGDTVTLTCQVTESEGWTFIWTRYTQGRVTQLHGSSGEGGSVYVLRSVTEKNSGMYQCEAVRGNNREFSNFHNITVWASPPQAVVVTDPPGSVMFTGETVTLSCDIKGSGWRYSWARNTQGRLESLSASSTETQQKHTLHSVTESDSGEYMCQGERGQNPKIQSLPEVLKLNVSDDKPKPVITHDPPGAEMYTGERVTLSCVVGGDPAGWEYLWYKDTQGTALPNTDSSRTDGSSYTISSAALSHSGEYWCRAARGRRSFYSEYSGSVTLDISVPPQAELTVQSGWTEVFPTERVTLRCEIQGSSTEWMYRWYRDGQELPVGKADSSSGNGDTYTILSADQSHTGLYTCRGQHKKRGFQSTICSAVKLHVLRKIPKPVITQNPPGAEVYTGERVTLSSPPQAELTVQSGWTEVFPTERVTLRCEIQGSSTEWMYRWYRDGQELPVDKADSSSGNGDTYTILSADQ
ncbi:hypothetical protein JZ751_014510, partial [Albula glossodonta]